MRPPPYPAETAAGRDAVVDVFRHSARVLGVCAQPHPEVVVMQVPHGASGTAVARIGSVVIRVSTGSSSVKAVVGCSAGQLLEQAGAPVAGLFAGPVLLPTDTARSPAGPAIAAAWRFRPGALHPGRVSTEQAHALGRACAAVAIAGRRLSDTITSPLRSTVGRAVLRQLAVHGRISDAGSLPQVVERAAPWDPFPLLATRIAACDWLDPDQIRTLRQLAECVVAGCATTDRVLVHGDFSPRNCGIDDDGEAFLFDFDSAALAPLGYDLACLWLRLHHEAGRPDLGRIAMASAMESGHPDLDVSQVQALVAVKAVVQIVFRLTQGPTEANRRFVTVRLRELAGLLRGEPLPERLIAPR